MNEVTGADETEQAESPDMPWPVKFGSLGNFAGMRCVCGLFQFVCAFQAAPSGALIAHMHHSDKHSCAQQQGRQCSKELWAAASRGIVNNTLLNSFPWYS